MKKELNLKKEELDIDPSIILNADLNEILETIKIKLISYSNDREIIINLYFIMKIYFNDVIVEDILSRSVSKEIRAELIGELRNKKLEDLDI